MNENLLTEEVVAEHRREGHWDEMRTAPILKLLVKYFLPALVGVIVSALYNIVDRVFLGQVDPLALAALSAIFPVVLVRVALGMLILREQNVSLDTHSSFCSSSGLFSLA